MSIDVDGLGKWFDRRAIVSNLRFAVAQGEVLGLIGPNGAGKTTTMRMLAGLLRPSAGLARICGIDIRDDAAGAKAKLGFLSASMGLYARLSPREMLDYYGALYGLSKADRRARMRELAQILRLTPFFDRPCGRLSTGERQRVSLARAVLHDPPVLILDEPSAGLDVLASRAVADFVRRLRRHGRAILFSTHYMTEAELLCDRIALLLEGEIRAIGTADELKKHFSADSLEAVFLHLQADYEQRKTLGLAEVVS